MHINAFYMKFYDVRFIVKQFYDNLNKSMIFFPYDKYLQCPANLNISYGKMIAIIATSFLKIQEKNQKIYTDIR